MNSKYDIRNYFNLYILVSGSWNSRPMHQQNTLIHFTTASPFQIMIAYARFAWPMKLRTGCITIGTKLSVAISFTLVAFVGGVVPKIVWTVRCVETSAILMLISGAMHAKNLDICCSLLNALRIKKYMVLSLGGLEGGKLLSKFYFINIVVKAIFMK